MSDKSHSIDFNLDLLGRTVTELIEDCEDIGNNAVVDKLVYLKSLVNLMKASRCQIQGKNE